MIESDEDFARRLQAEENGFDVRGSNSEQPRPILNGRENETVINARLNDINSSRSVLCVLFSVNMPQVLATVIVLSMHWNDPNVCDEVHTLRWKWWAIFSALRMLSYSFLILFMHVYKPILDQNPQLLMKTVNARNAIDAFNLVWFIVGNMWLFGDDGDACDRSDLSPIYNLCKAMLIIIYIQICLPCILAILLVPIFCFCMPCLIRLLARLNPRRTEGATESVLETLPVVTITAEDLRAASGAGDTAIEETSTPAAPIICPICLNEMAVGDQIREIRCKHIFHRECVDHWLRINASCPTCRKRIVDDPADGEGGTEVAGGSGDIYESTGGTYRSLSMAEAGRSDRTQEIPLLRTNTRSNNSNNSNNNTGNNSRNSSAIASRILSIT